MKHIILFFAVHFFISCKPEGVKKDKSNDKFEKEYTQTKKDKEEIKKLSLKPTKKIEKNKLDNGIKIDYFVHGDGPKFKEGDVAQINYEVLLDDGTFVDGNKLLNKEWLPFMVGFGMQTPGWDIAFKKLRVGDFVEIYLPSRFARGKIGIKGLIPPNSNNTIRLKIIGKLEPSRIVDGTKVWLLEENANEKLLADVENEIDFHYIVGTKSRPRYDISYRRNQPYNMKFSDFGIVKGLKKALINAKKSDKIWVLIPPSEAYGAKGLQDLIKPYEHVFYDIFIMDVR